MLRRCVAATCRRAALRGRSAECGVWAGKDHGKDRIGIIAANRTVGKSLETTPGDQDGKDGR